ncbi:MAG: LmeA family phospholipid-binding protein [Candidatus Melainabacteria bacterium]|nr:LmeA family phospholipid-binding protein [Candidatus Melainabacteria bacterium]
MFSRILALMILLGILMGAVLPLVFAEPAAKPPSSAATAKPGLVTAGVQGYALPNAGVEAVRVDLKKGFFAGFSADHMVLNLQGINLQHGSMQTLHALMEDAFLDFVPLDRVEIHTNAFQFDTFQLINNRRIVLDRPIAGHVNLQLTEQNLNVLLAQPKTKEKLERAIAKQTGNLKLVEINAPVLEMLGKDKFRLTFQTAMAGALTVPVEMEGTLALRQGELSFSNLQMVSAGLPLPVDLAKVLEAHLNKVLDFKTLGGRYFDLKATRLDTQHKKITLEGTATLTQLEMKL